jgi:hypothetical protein
LNAFFWGFQTKPLPSLEESPLPPLKVDVSSSFFGLENLRTKIQRIERAGICRPAIAMIAISGRLGFVGTFKHFTRDTPLTRTAGNTRIWRTNGFD